MLKKGMRVCLRLAVLGGLAVPIAVTSHNSNTSDLDQFLPATVVSESLDA